MYVRCNAKSVRTLRFKNRDSITVFPGRTEPITQEQVDEAMATPAGKAWFDEGQLSLVRTPAAPIVPDLQQTGTGTGTGAGTGGGSDEPGIFAGIANKKVAGILEDNAYETLEDVADADVADLVALDGIAEATATKVIAAAKEAVAAAAG